MKVAQISNCIWQLTRLGSFNCQLVRDEDESLTLIDTGLKGTADSILATAKSIGLPIRRILLTHAHMDHVGSLDQVTALTGPVEVIIGERESRLYEGNFTLDPNEPQTKIRGGFKECKTILTRLPQGDEHVGPFRAIFAPGHTPGHLAYFDERDHSLFAGDALSSVGRLTVSGVFNWLFPFPVFATWHFATAIETAERLAALNPRLLVLGHGKVLESPRLLMERAIAAAKRKLRAG